MGILFIACLEDISSINAFLAIPSQKASHDASAKRIQSL